MKFAWQNLIELPALVVGSPPTPKGAQAMNTKLIGLVSVTLTMVLLLLTSWGAASARGEEQGLHHVRPLAFEANRGQADEQVKFLARGAGYTVFLDAHRGGRGAGPGPSRAGRGPPEGGRRQRRVTDRPRRRAPRRGELLEGRTGQQVLQCSDLRQGEIRRQGIPASTSSTTAARASSSTISCSRPAPIPARSC